MSLTTQAIPVDIQQTLLAPRCTRSAYTRENSHEVLSSFTAFQDLDPTSTHSQVSPWPKDFVKNKSQGRMFLLHGPSGAGKTYTAECVADPTRRPLIPLTSGDLNTLTWEHHDNLTRGLSPIKFLSDRFRSGR
ncbi:hypothetical protein F5Y11DRAFT_337703 [Daldinia sp. FL1419]|nr:hypothetical protein F5Y11DRAFT_337703 [Daldinia sp. FL1419]